MPKRGRKFITEFLIPNLNDERLGARLAWVDRQFSVFQIQWNHKSATDWTEDDFQVFVEWDKRRGHYRPKEKEYFTKSKQRFRAVLNKSIQDKEITQLKSEDKNIKLYFLGPPDEVPFGKFDVKDIIDDKEISYSLFLKTDLENSTFPLGQDQLTNPYFYYNALKDHNYQNFEEKSIPENDYSINDDASQNDLSLYLLSGTEKNAPTGINILELQNDEGFWKNECLPILNPEKRPNFLPGGYDGSSVGLNSVDAFVSATIIKDHSLKRKVEYSDDHTRKKSKILIYLKKS